MEWVKDPSKTFETGGRGRSLWQDHVTRIKGLNKTQKCHAMAVPPNDMGGVLRHCRQAVATALFGRYEAAKKSRYNLGSIGWLCHFGHHTKWRL
jgi:hypothetical protein